MTPRRSSRLRDPPGGTSSPMVSDAPSQAERGTKRSSPAGRETTQSARGAKKARVPTTNATKRVVPVRTEGRNARNSDRLSSLSPEIFSMIADHITKQSTISALMRASKSLYTLMAPRLYNRIAVAAMFHAHIAKLIRTLEPHLTTDQKKQLKKEGKYKGQQEKYPTGLDGEKVPVCAGYVRQLVIGVSDPGKKHKYIVDRYYEEALKNMKNLEIVETRVVNQSICESVSSLPGLKALSVYAHDAAPDDVAPLAHVKNLRHLDLHLGCNTVATTGQSLIRNSRSTLQTLSMASNWDGCHYFEKWETNLKSSWSDTTDGSDKEPHLPALRSLHIVNTLVNAEFIEQLSMAVDLSRLHELELNFSHPRDSSAILWSFLADKMKSYRHSNSPLSLRTLSIEMHDSQFLDEPEAEEARFLAKCAFIASFDTLTTLKLPGYGQFRSGQGLTNPGLSDTLLRAILKHKSLRVLKLSYGGVISGLDIPYLGAKPIGDIIDGLPELRKLEFAPDESKMDEISQALSRGRNLESVTCFPHESWVGHPRPDPLGVNILSSILSTFMSSAKDDVDGGRFVWEDHYKLHHIDLSHTTWEIASDFGKQRKGQGKREQLQVEVGDDTRKVRHMIVPRTHFIHIGYDPTFQWVAKVEKEIG